MRIIITDDNNKKILLSRFKNLINKKRLSEFAQKSGYYGDGFMALIFKEEMVSDWKWEEELADMKDKQVLLLAEYPATNSEDKDSEENLYLDFDEFYDYLAEVVREKVEENPEEKEEYNQLLTDIKIALEV